MPQVPLPPRPPEKKYFIIQCHFDELDDAYFFADYMHKIGNYYIIWITTKKGELEIKSVTVEEFKNFNNYE